MERDCVLARLRPASTASGVAGRPGCAPPRRRAPLLAPVPMWGQGARRTPHLARIGAAASAAFQRPGLRRVRTKQRLARPDRTAAAAGVLRPRGPGRNARRRSRPPRPRPWKRRISSASARRWRLRERGRGHPWTRWRCSSEEIAPPGDGREKRAGRRPAGSSVELAALSGVFRALAAARSLPDASSSFPALAVPRRHGVPSPFRHRGLSNCPVPPQSKCDLLTPPCAMVRTRHDPNPYPLGPAFRAVALTCHTGRPPRPSGRAAAFDAADKRADGDLIPSAGGFPRHGAGQLRRQPRVEWGVVPTANARGGGWYRDGPERPCCFVSEGPRGRTMLAVLGRAGRLSGDLHRRRRAGLDLCRTLYRCADDLHRAARGLLREGALPPPPSRLPRDVSGPMMCRGRILRTATPARRHPAAWRGVSAGSRRWPR